MGTEKAPQAAVLFLSLGPFYLLRGVPLRLPELASPGRISFAGSGLRWLKWYYVTDGCKSLLGQVERDFPGIEVALGRDGGNNTCRLTHAHA